MCKNEKGWFCISCTALLAAFVMHLLDLPGWTCALYSLLPLFYAAGMGFCVRRERLEKCAWLWGLSGACLAVPQMLMWNLPLPLAAGVLAVVGLLCLFICSGVKRYTAHRIVSAPSASLGLSPAASFWLTFFYALFALCLVWSFVYPAGMTDDSLNQWQQVHGAIDYADIHAIGHTLLLKLLYAICDQTAFIAFVQILAIAVMYAFFAKLLAEKGVSPVWLLALLTVFLSSVSKAETYVFLWKDTPYTVCIGIVTYFLIRVIDKKRLSLLAALTLGVGLAGIPLMRLNGLVAFIPSIIYLGICFIKGKQWRTLALTTLACLCAFAGVQIGSRLMNTRHMENATSVMPFATGVASVVADGGEMTDTQARQLHAIFTDSDIAWMQEHYTPWRTRDLYWIREYYTNPNLDEFQDPNMYVYNNRYVISVSKHRMDVVRLYISLLPDHWKVMLRDIVYNTYSVWSLYAEDFPYCNAFMLLVGLAVLWGVGKRFELSRRWPIFLPVVCNMLSIALSATTNEYRYLLPTYALFPVLIPWIVGQARSDGSARPTDLRA